MSDFLAPNGEKSNLTPEQYKLVRTTAFKEWFGDWENSPETASKIVDDNGEPLPVYHGTSLKNRKDIEKFGFDSSKGRNGLLGFSFMSNIEYVKPYNKGSIIPVFLNIRQPMDYDFNFEIRTHILKGLGKTFKTMTSSDWIKHTEYISKEFMYISIKLGYDGIFQPNQPEISVFKNTNIKLADGSNTTFDSSKASILFENGGEARPFTDDGNKLVVFNQYRNYTPYKIAVDDINNAEYITLWKTDTDTGEDKKMGYLRLNNSGDDFLSVSETSIDKGSKGLGLGLLMYKVALKYSSDKIKGIKSYLPDRTNKKQIPKIYKKLNSVKDGDYEFIYKENNPDIRFNEGGSVLLAPNGEPSNLTPEQYKLVRQKAFKKWFGDWEILILTKINKSVIDEVSLKRLEDSVSKVVDSNGEPLVVYHGSDMDFNVFKKGRNNPYAEKQGYFFAYNKKYSASFNSKYIKDYFLNLKIRGRYDDDDVLIPTNADGLIIEGLQIEIFDNKNIKLANGTNTTFDGNNPDIRFKDGGEIVYLKGKKNKLWKILQKHYLTKWEAEIDNENYSQLNIFKEGDVSEIINVKAFDEKNYYDFDMFEKQIAKILKDKLVDKIELEYGDYEGERTHWLTLYEVKNPDIRFEEGGKVDLSEYNRALKEVYPLIPQISHKIIHENNLPHNKETIIKLNKEIIEKVKRGDDKTLDLMWDIAWSLSLKHSINVITYYHKKYKNGGLTKKIKFHIEDDEEEERIKISIKDIGEVILSVTYPEYEFLEDVGEDGLEELNVEEGDMIGKIEHLEIEDEYKRQGYAKLLMNKAIEVAKEKGLMPLYLNASPMGSKRYGLNIEDLTGFYESLGFEVFLRQGGNNLMILKDTYKTGGEAKNNNMEKQIKIQFADNNYANGGVTYSEWSKDDFWQEQFNDWKKDGNVSKNTDGTYSTQDAQYTNSLRGIIGLKKYFYNEFVKGQYAGGGKAVKKYVVVGEVYDGGEVWKETFDNLDEALDLAREIENGWTDDGTYYLITIYNETGKKVAEISDDKYFNELTENKLFKKFDLSADTKKQRQVENEKLKGYKFNLQVLIADGGATEIFEKTFDSIFDVMDKMNTYYEENYYALINGKDLEYWEEEYSEINESRNYIKGKYGWSFVKEGDLWIAKDNYEENHIVRLVNGKITSDSSISKGALKQIMELEAQKKYSEKPKHNQSLSDMKKIWDKLSKNYNERENIAFLIGYYGGLLSDIVPNKWDDIDKGTQIDIMNAYFGQTEEQKQKRINEYRKRHEALVKEHKTLRNLYGLEKKGFKLFGVKIFEQGGSTDDKHLIAKAIEFIIGTAIDKDSIEIESTEISYKRKNINVRTSIDKKLINDTILMHRKSLEGRYAEGGSVGKGYSVFNYTDNIYATDEVFKTKKLANDFIKQFRNRFSKQGYYRDNQMNKIAVEDIDLLAIPSDFNPFGKYEDGGEVIVDGLTKQDFIDAFQNRVEKLIQELKKEGTYENTFDSLYEIIEKDRDGGFTDIEETGFWLSSQDVDGYDKLAYYLSFDKNVGYRNYTDKVLSHFYFGKPMKIEFVLNTGGDTELGLEDELQKIKLLLNKIDFNKVVGSIDYDKTKNNTDLDFYKDVELVMSLNGDWNETTEELDTTIDFNDETAELNYHPLDTMGGLDLTQLEENINEAFRELNTYSAVVSIEGYEEYAEDVEGLENAKALIQDIKGNTRFQVLKGSSVGIGKRVDDSRVIEEFKKGGETGFDDTNTSMVIYHEEKGNPLIPKNQIYLWLYEGENASEKLETGEYDFVMYPYASLSISGQKGFIPPLKKIWTKKFQKQNKGSEYLIGVIKAHLLNDGKELYIDMMSVNPSLKKHGVMSYMIKDLRDTFNLTQDQVTFSNLTEEGKKFVAKKTYANGGGVGEFPPKGELTNKDNFLLKYEKRGGEYEFLVYKPITKEVSGYNQIKHVCLNKDCPQKMTYEQFIHYLYAELYLDDKKFADGGQIKYDLDGNKYMIDNGNYEPFKNGDLAYNPFYDSVVSIYFDKNDENADNEDYVNNTYSRVKIIESYATKESFVRALDEASREHEELEHKDYVLHHEEDRGRDWQNPNAKEDAQRDLKRSLRRKEIISIQDKIDNIKKEYFIGKEGKSELLKAIKFLNDIGIKSEWNGSKGEFPYYKKGYNSASWWLIDAKTEFTYIGNQDAQQLIEFATNLQNSERYKGLSVEQIKEKRELERKKEEIEKERARLREESDDNKWIVKYISTMDDDVASVWVIAENREDAILQAEEDNWDIGEIISVESYEKGGGVDDKDKEYDDLLEKYKDIQSQIDFEKNQKEIDYDLRSRLQEELNDLYQVLNTKYKEKFNSIFANGGEIYVHKYNPNITLEFIENTNKGIKGLQKNPKSLSKKERNAGIIVNYSDSEIKELFNKKYADGGDTEEVYIEFLNKEKGFKKDVKHFNSYEEAVEWARENFDKFNPDMIKYKYADGGGVGKSIRGFKVGDLFYITPSTSGNKRYYKITSIDKYDVKADDYDYVLNGTDVNTGRKSSFTTGSFGFMVDEHEISRYEKGDLGYAKGGDVPHEDKMFQLPLEMVVYVPSTQDVDKVISVDKMDKRVDEVKEYLASKFGGYTSSDKLGGYVDSTGNLVNEDVVQVTSFSTQEAYDENKEELINQLAKWGKQWGQEAIGFEFEGDLMYVPQELKNETKVDEYRRGGFMYEVQKKGSPSNDMRETMFTAKNLTELKKKIIEKYGTSEGFIVSRRTEQGYYVPVKFKNGGSTDDYNSLTRSEIADKIAGLRLRIAKTKKQVSTFETTNRGKFNNLWEQKVVPLQKELDLLSDLWGNAKYSVGGAIYPDLSLQKADVVNDSVVLDEFQIKKTKNTFQINGLENLKISKSDDAVKILRELFEKDTMSAYEQAVILYFNKNNKVIGYYNHSSGGIDGTIMDVEMISGMALKSLAKGVIIAHNHPSENTMPSDADKRITKQLNEALKLFNIQLLDSIILTENSHLSFQEQGLIF